MPKASIGLRARSCDPTGEPRMQSPDVGTFRCRSIWLRPQSRPRRTWLGPSGITILSVKAARERLVRASVGRSGLPAALVDDAEWRPETADARAAARRHRRSSRWPDRPPPQRTSASSAARNLGKVGEVKPAPSQCLLVGLRADIRCEHAKRPVLTQSGRCCE